MARPESPVDRSERRAAELGARALDLRRLGRHAAAVELLRAAVRLAPRHAGLVGNLGNALLACGEGPEARRLLARAAALDPSSGLLAYNLGKARLDAGEFDQARAAFERAIALGGVEAEARVNLGRVHEIEGRREEAAEEWRHAAELAPALARPHYLLARIGRLEAHAPLERLAEGPDTPPEARVEACFGLGYAFEHEGAFARAFAWFERGNAQKRALLPPFDPAAHEARLAALARGFSAKFLRSVPGAHPSELPLFVVGLPRSGTTLVESILAAHPAVAARGERLELEREVRALARQRDPERSAELPLAERRAAAERYLAALAIPPEARRATDKLPGNYVHLGWIALLFAQARIVHCRRDPLDTALSLYTQLFEGDSLAFCYDLGHIARVTRAYQGLMAHWRAVLPLPLHELDYEDLVRDVEPASRALVASAGLEWDERCLARSSKGAVLTASAWRVRAPIDTRSIGRWRHYERELAPLRAALEAAA